MPSSWERGAAYQAAPISFGLTLFLAMAAAYVTVACVAAATTDLVSAKMIEGLVSTLRIWTNVAVMWIEAVINVTTKIAWAVEPGATSDEDTAAEPLRPVVPVWGAVVWSETL